MLPFVSRHTTAAERIEPFLKRHQRDELWVCTGFVSASGLAWLAERTHSAQPVTVLTTKLDDAFRASPKATPTNQQAAVEFLGRRNVELRCWYRPKRADTPRRDYHAKAFIASPLVRSEALVGSMNLTWTGLKDNAELVGELTADEAARVAAQTRTILKQAHDQTDAAVAKIAAIDVTTNRPQSVTRESPRSLPRGRTSRRSKRRKRRR